jgi:biopolymer transport protein ExbD
MWTEPHVYRYRRSRLFINVTSLVDVLFILLLFFILSTTFNRFGSLDVNLPSTQTAPPPADKAPQMHEVMIYKDGHYSLDGTRLSLKELVRKTKSWSPQEKFRPILLKADQEVAYGLVMQLLDKLRSEGILKIQALTRNE